MKLTVRISCLLTLVMGLLATGVHAQKWKKDKPSTLYAVNKKKKSDPVFVGIGLKNPEAQFHTTGTVRFQGLANSDAQTRIVVTDQNGNLYFRNLNTLTVTGWSLVGNSGTNPSINFMGTTDNTPVVFKTNGIERMRLTTPADLIPGVDVGSPSTTAALSIYGRDSVQYGLPLTITGKIMNQSFGNSPGQTLGRLIRLNQGPSAANGGVNWYDLGIGQDTSFFITNHQVPPTSGNGVIRKRMITISKDDRVGINLGPTAKPTANLHSDGTVRFENLPTNANTLQKVVMVDDAGNLFWKDKSAVGGTASNAWNLTGNAGTTPATNFIGSTDNTPVVFKSNNVERMRLTTPPDLIPGVDIGSPSTTAALSIYGRDSVQYGLPLTITGKIMGQTFGNTPSQTLGRLIRLNQGPSAANGGMNWYDIGIGQDTSFFITNHSVPPTSGNGVIRKRMITISTEDKVGINLGPTAKPTANLHSDGTVRHENLPTNASTLQKVVMIDDAGNLFWKDKSAVAGASGWSLTGNAGTSASTNFIGTTDANPLIFKSNNVERMRLRNEALPGLDIGSPTNSVGVNIYGRDSVQYGLPLTVTGNIVNQTFGNTPGQTLGRLIRLNQGPSAMNGGVNWYDIGIGPDSSFFITNHTVPPTSGNGVIRKRMITISTEDKVGINLAPNAKPTANLHSDGTVRFQNLPSGAGNVLVVDANGNVFKSSAVQNRQSTDEVADLKEQIRQLKEEVESMRSVINNLKGGFVDATPTTDRPTLEQNNPNPFNKSTRINYYIPGDAKNAMILITAQAGQVLKTYNLNTGSKQSLMINAGELGAGTYTYTLVVDGKTIDSKRLVLTR